MRHWLVTTAAVLACASASPSFAEEAAGDWTGVLGTNFKVTLHLDRDANGHYEGYMRSADQGANIPLDNIVATHDTLAFHGSDGVRANGRYEGHWAEARKQWVGIWTQGASTDLIFTRASAATALRPEEKGKAMDDLVQNYAEDGYFMGSVLVMQDGKILLDKGYGFADVTHATPDTPQTAYRIGSVTKQFTAASILLLQERGKLKISDSVRTYLPDAPVAWDHISLYHLLTHTSGLGNYLADLGSAAPPDKLPEWVHDMTWAQLMEVIRNEPLKFEPGSHFFYSNSGYAVLGMIVEKVSGESYGEFVHDNLFAPAGMTQSIYDPKAIPAGEAVGYGSGAYGPVPMPLVTISASSAAGGIVSTTHDLALWQAALFGGNILKPDSLKQMTTPFKQGFAMGLEVAQPFGHLDIGHEGGVPGFRAYVHYEPDSRLGIIALANIDRDMLTRLGNGLDAIVHGQAGNPPPPPVVVPPDVLASYAGTYTLTPAVSLVVIFDNGQMTAQITGFQRVVLYARSQTLFYSDIVSDKTLEFIRAADGSISVIMHRDGLPDLPGTRR